MWNISIETAAYILIIGLHLFTFVDVLKNLKKQRTPIIVVLAFFPPILGPVIYFLIKSWKPRQPRAFMGKKRRFS